MAIAIPDATLGATFTNDITGTTYTYDGQKWVAEGGGSGNYVSKSGDTMSGDLSIIAPRETREDPLLYLKPESGATPTQYLLQVGSTDGAKNNLVVQDDGEIWSRAGWTPSNDRHLTPKKYVDSTKKVQPTFTYEWGGFEYPKPTTEEEAALVVGKMFATNPHPISQLRLHWEDSEGQLLCLPTGQGTAASKGGKLYIFDAEPDDPEYKNPRRAKSATPDGRKMYASRIITYVDRDDDGQVDKRYIPIYRINLEENLPEIPLGKKLIIQFGGILV